MPRGKYERKNLGGPQPPDPTIVLQNSINRLEKQINDVFTPNQKLAGNVVGAIELSPVKISMSTSDGTKAVGMNVPVYNMIPRVPDALQNFLHIVYSDNLVIDSIEVKVNIKPNQTEKES